MGWDDIDFDTIVAGATTNDVDSVQNFYIVLNTFGIALDERVKVTTSTGALPILPDIRFAATGEIRAGDTFMGKYRALLDGYFNIWDDFDWYDPAALLDPVNYLSFALDDTDLEAAMGENAYDLLINRVNKNRIQLWSADLLNGLYELYKLTQVHTKPLFTLFDDSVVRYNTPVRFRNSDEHLVYSGGGTSFQEGYAAAKADYDADFSSFVDVVGSSTARIITWDEDISGNTENNFVIDASGGDTETVTIKCLDLTESAIDLDIVGTGAAVVANYISETVDENPPIISTYNAAYPLVALGDSPISVEIDAKNTNADPVLGFRYEFFEYGSPTVPAFPPFVDPSNIAGNVDVEFDVFFQIEQHKRFLIDVNNVALDFFIAP